MNSESISDKSNEEVKPIQYKNRRWQAWLSLVSIIVMALTLMFGNEIPATNTEVIKTVIYALSAICLVYSGGVALVDAAVEIFRGKS